MRTFLLILNSILFSQALGLPLRAEDHPVKNGSRESAKPGETIPVNQHDVLILQRAAKILGDGSRWNRNDDRECPPAAKTFSLYCALWKASVEINGEFDHRAGAMEELRRTVEEMTQGRSYEHRLMGFNNDPKTSLADVKKAIRDTERRIAARLKPGAKDVRQ